MNWLYNTLCYPWIHLLICLECDTFMYKYAVLTRNDSYEISDKLQTFVNHIRNHYQNKMATSNKTTNPQPISRWQITPCWISLLGNEGSPAYVFCLECKDIQPWNGCYQPKQTIVSDLTWTLPLQTNKQVRHPSSRQSWSYSEVM